MVSSICLGYYCRCISGSKVWLAECLPLLLLKAISESKEWLAEVFTLLMLYDVEYSYII